MAAIDRAEGEFDGIPKKLFWKALHLVLWDTGGRISELLAIEWDRIEGRWLFIPPKARKGIRSDVFYQLRAETIDAIEEFASRDVPKCMSGRTPTTASTTNIEKFSDLLAWKRGRKILSACKKQ